MKTLKQRERLILYCRRWSITSLRAVLLAMAVTISPSLFASSEQCFSVASSFYEQVYCQILAENSGQRLPDFWEFKKNDENIQALLLKPHARKLGIKLPARKKPLPVVVRAPSMVTDTLSGCELQGKIVSCAGQFYRLVGNRHNRELDAHALSIDARLGLPVDSGSRNAIDINHYLSQAYAIYLRKMHAIGLGGVTMSFDKFGFIFDDLRSKEVDFAGRFETMFSYLKKDKLSNAVRTAARLPDGFTTERCQRFENMLSCAFQRRNYLFL